MYQNISDWLTVDYLIAYKVLLTACHICFHQKSTTLAYVLEVTFIFFQSTVTHQNYPCSGIGQAYAYCLLALQSFESL